MKQKYMMGLLGIVLMVVIGAVLIMVRSGAAQQPADPSNAATDPQRLMIPRWFLNDLTLDGQSVEIPADQQSITIQFTQDGNANGKGGCNQFSGSFTASPDGKLSFGPLMATEMACKNMMAQESAYFSALDKVSQFHVEGGQLTLSSADGKTSLVYRMPPK